MTSEQAKGFSIFGRKITRSLVLVAVVMVLSALNLYLWSLSTWHSEQFIDNVALTQNAFRNLFDEFDKLMEEETLREEYLQGLEEWVEKTSIQSAKVTFLDQKHSPLWEKISDSLELFEKLLEDLRVPVRMQSVNGLSAILVICCRLSTTTWMTWIASFFLPTYYQMEQYGRSLTMSE